MSAHQPQHSPATPQAARTNGKAIAALILPLVLGLPGGIAGLILGYMAKNEIDQSGGAQSGRGFALAGIILGWVVIALSVLFLLVLVL